MILSTTLLIVIVTVIVNGGSTMSVLSWLGVPTGVLEDPGEHDPIVNSPLHGYHTVEDGAENTERPAPARRQQSKPEKSWLAQQWAGIDTKIFKPLLTHASPTLLETLPNRCIGLARVFTSREQLEKHPMMRKVEESSSGELESGTFGNGSTNPQQTEEVPAGQNHY